MSKTMTWETFRLEFDEDGTLRLRGREGWREPICHSCGEPIKWVLDMASFEPDHEGGHVLCHARCVWTRAGFQRQARLAAP